MLTCSPGARCKKDNRRFIQANFYQASFGIWSPWEVLQRSNLNCKSPTWSSSDSSLIFFTSHLLATTMRGCRERDTSVTTITCTQTYYTVKPNCRQTCWFCRILPSESEHYGFKRQFKSDNGFKRMRIMSAPVVLIHLWKESLQFASN